MGILNDNPEGRVSLQCVVDFEAVDFGCVQPATRVGLRVYPYIVHFHFHPYSLENEYLGSAPHTFHAVTKTVSNLAR